jgi:hypothetical protein
LTDAYSKEQNTRLPSARSPARNRISRLVPKLYLNTMGEDMIWNAHLATVPKRPYSTRFI